MRDGRGTWQTARPRAGRARLLSCLVLAALCLPAGCRSTSPEPKQAPIDPLLGGPPLQQKGTSAPSSSSRADATPALPAPSSSTSPAALANGAVPSLDPSRELAINDRGTGAPVTPTGGWRGPGSAVGGATPDVQLRPPQTAGPPGVPPRQDAPPIPTGPRAASFEQAEDLLRTRGVTWQRLETAADSGDWKFTCFVPNRTNPNVHRTYEAQARDQLAALQAVIDQIDRESAPGSPSGR